MLASENVITNLRAVREQGRIRAILILKGRIATLIAKVCTGVALCLIRESVEEPDIDDINARIRTVIGEILLVGALTL